MSLYSHITGRLTFSSIHLYAVNYGGKFFEIVWGFALYVQIAENITLSV